MVADLVSILEALTHGGGELPLLVGHSMGAGVAGTVLATRPDLVCAGVPENPPWFTRPPGDSQPPEPDNTQQWVRTFRDDPDGAMARGRAENPLMPEIELRPWAVSKAQLDPSLTDPEQIVRQAPWIEVAATIALPTLVVTGDRDDAVLVGTLSRGRLADLGNQHIEVALVPGAGHTVRRDRTDAFHQIVDPWIRDRLSAAVS